MLCARDEKDKDIQAIHNKGHVFGCDYESDGVDPGASFQVATTSQDKATSIVHNGRRYKVQVHVARPNLLYRAQEKATLTVNELRERSSVRLSLLFMGARTNTRTMLVEIGDFQC